MKAITSKMKNIIPFRRISVLVCLTLFTALPSLYSSASEIETEVLIMVQDEEVLAFSAYKSHWVPVDIRLAERILEKRSQGNIGIVVTTKRILGFSALTDQWTINDLKMNEEVEEINVEGNAATIKTNKKVIGYSAHTGSWIEAP